MLHKRDSYFVNQGINETWFVDDITGAMTVQRTQDIDPVLAEIKIRREEPMDKEMYPAAEIPIVEFEKYCAKRGYDPLIHEERDRMRMLQDMLNDPDYAHFRIWNGRVGRHK